jgi:DNA-binding transcriptional MerR regulator
MTSYVPTYNLKAVVIETGLSPATLRAWERRYGLIQPQRSSGGHRLYSEHDIQMLKWLVEKQKEGMSISNAVELWRSLEKIDQDPLQQIHAPAQMTGAGGSFLDDLRNEWITACLAFNEQAAVQLLGQAFAIAAPEVVCSEILQKGLAEIGERWYAGKVSVQQEHFASMLSMRRLVHWLQPQRLQHVRDASWQPARLAKHMSSSC